METEIVDLEKSERSVEILFTCESITKYFNSTTQVLEVGGVPTDYNHYAPIYDALQKSGCNYSISDFRGGEYQGDFVTYDFGDKKFDAIMFISSLEHFPQCTEGDLVFREAEDRKGYKKALSLLHEGGIIFLTVPFGKPVWQEYHQNYNWEKILELTEGSIIKEANTYSLDEENNKWVSTDPAKMEEILYTNRAYGVGCFVLEKG